MAKLNFGILGPAIGTLSNLVTYLRLGQPLVRTKPKKRAKKAKRSDSQKAVNLKFQIVKKFLSVTGEFINVGYRNDVAGTSRIPENGASSYLLSEAFTGEYPNLSIDYAKVLVSRGKLSKPLNAEVKLEGNLLKFTWDADAVTSYPRIRDQVMLLAYLPANETTNYLLSGARRKDGFEELEVAICRQNLSDMKKDEVIETYMAFISDDRKSISDSVYVGSVVI